MLLMFTNEEKNQVIVRGDSKSDRVFSYPPVSDEDKELVAEYGGEAAIVHQTAAFAHDLEREAHKVEQYNKFKGNWELWAVVNDDYSKADLMSFKMEVFKQDCVRMCKDKELMKQLRKAEDAITAITCYGKIKEAHDSSASSV